MRNFMQTQTVEDVVPQLTEEFRTVFSSGRNGYLLKCPDREGFIYPLERGEQGEADLVLMYQDREHFLVKILPGDYSLDFAVRNKLIDASQMALLIMYPEGEGLDGD